MIIASSSVLQNIFGINKPLSNLFKYCLVVSLYGPLILKIDVFHSLGFYLQGLCKGLWYYYLDTYKVLYVRILLIYKNNIIDVICYHIWDGKYTLLLY